MAAPPLPFLTGLSGGLLIKAYVIGKMLSLIETGKYLDPGIEMGLAEKINTLSANIGDMESEIVELKKRIDELLERIEKLGAPVAAASWWLW